VAKSIRSFLSLLLVLQLIIPYSTFAAAVGEFTSVVGDVMQTRATEVIRPVAKSPIEMEDLIATDRASSTSMVFSDDSTIMLAENTKLEIKEFLFKDKSRTGIFSLMIGRVTATVKKFIGGDNVFEVHSPTAVVGVRGTGFEFIEAAKDGNAGSNLAGQGMATVTCTDGSLTVSALSPAGVVTSTMVIEAGQVAVIIGGVITLSKIGAAVVAAVGRATETGGAVTTGGTGTGTGGTVVTGSGATTATAGGASGGAAAVAAATGMSTAAIVGISIGGAALVGGAAAAAGGGTTTQKPTPAPTPVPTPAPCSSVAGTYYGSASGTDCRGLISASLVISPDPNCGCEGITSAPGILPFPCSVSGNNLSVSCPTTYCGTLSATGTFSGNQISGTFSYQSGGGGTFSGSR
jgi:hypothetical protein